MTNDTLESLNVKSFTAVSNDETKRSALTKALAGCMIALSLSGGMIHDVQADESSDLSNRVMRQVMIDEARNLKHHQDAWSLTKATAVKVLKGEPEFRVDDAHNLAEGVPDYESTASRIGRVASFTSNAVQFAINPTEKAISTGAQVVIGSTAALATNDLNHGLHAAGAVGTIALAATMAPVGAALYGGTQAYNTYTYIKSSKVRNEALQQLQIKKYEEDIQWMAHEMRLESYKGERAEWDDLPDKVRASKQALFTEAAIEHLQDPTKATWIKGHLDLEHEVGHELRQYMPWFEDAMTHIAQLELDQAAEQQIAQDNQPGPATGHSASQSFDAFNNSLDSKPGLSQSSSASSFASFASATGTDGSEPDSKVRNNSQLRM